MRPPCNETVMHGVRVAIPNDWEDWTMFRFCAPDVVAEDLPPQLRVKKNEAGALPFRANAIVRRHRLAPGSSLVAMLEASTTDLRRQNPTCRVLALGAGEYCGQAAVCQDLTFVDASTRLQLFQRQIAVANAAGDAVVLTVTSDRSALDEVSPGLTVAKG
jgi:hypothetical protein